jgi:thiamine-monophosphate kinase
LNEFDIIRRYFLRQGVSRGDVIKGIGDDAAILEVPADKQLVVSTDVLVEGIHFPANAQANSIGYKALAVNLSDLAAMGAEPAWFTLNLCLPEINESWLKEFSCGMLALAEKYSVQLVGGDTVRGPLVVGIQVSGFVPAGEALRRDGAQPGDSIYITGPLGDAALALLHQNRRLELSSEQWRSIRMALEQPVPRVEAGQALRDIASSAIDISDGLVSDLGHVLEASDVGARIHIEKIPVSDIYRAYWEDCSGYAMALTHGDDYELCVTIPPGNISGLKEISAKLGCQFHKIGEIELGNELRCFDGNGQRWKPVHSGYNHFTD